MTKPPSSWKQERQKDLRHLDLKAEAPAGKVFDPANASDCRVLRVSTEMADLSFGTIDDTELIITVENASQYYLALNVRVQVDLALKPLESTAASDDANMAPDENLLIELIPNEQHIECLMPQASRRLHYRVISRGTEIGCYKFGVALDYSIVYWDGRPAALRRTFLLPVGVPPKGIIRSGTRPLPTDREIYRGKENDHE
jgi:hypothetical protein